MLAARIDSHSDDAVGSGTSAGQTCADPLGRPSNVSDAPADEATLRLVVPVDVAMQASVGRTSVG